MTKRAPKSKKSKALPKKTSFLEGAMLRHDYFLGLAKKELEKGDAASLEKIKEYTKIAQEAGDSIAPYVNRRLSPTDSDPNAPGTTTKVIRVKDYKEYKTPEAWLADYGEKNDVERAISEAASSDKVDQLIQKARGGVPIELPDLPKEQLN